MLLTAKFKINSLDFSEVCRPFELALVTKLLNLNAPQSVSLSAVPLGNINIFVYKNHIFNFLFAKIKFLQLSIFLVGSS